MNLRLGTAGWSYKDWVGPFYPTGTKPTDMLSHYAGVYSTVELDSSFYGTPAPATVEAWGRRIPAGFQLCPKLPQEISHTKFLVGCEKELEEFLASLARLGLALGPMVLQFPYFRRDSGIDLAEFVSRLSPFLDLFRRLSEPGMRLAVEVRNRKFLRPPLCDLLARHNAALALIDHPYMPDPQELLDRPELITTDFSYLRLLGDRNGIERITKTWNRLVLDQGWRLDAWVEWIRELLPRMPVYVFANNHYGGYAPGTVAAIRARIEPREGLRQLAP